jgi:hypothetical protein
MSILAELKHQGGAAFFWGWEKFVPAQKIEASRAAMKQLIDDLAALGLDPAEDNARAVVSEYVLRFNELGEGWVRRF